MDGFLISDSYYMDLGFGLIIPDLKPSVKESDVDCGMTPGTNSVVSRRVWCLSSKHTNTVFRVLTPNSASMIYLI